MAYSTTELSGRWCQMFHKLIPHYWTIELCKLDWSWLQRCIRTRSSPSKGKACSSDTHLRTYNQHLGLKHRLPCWLADSSGYSYQGRSLRVSWNELVTSQHDLCQFNRSKIQIPPQKNWNTTRSVSLENPSGQDLIPLMWFFRGIGDYILLKTTSVFSHNLNTEVESHE